MYFVKVTKAGGGHCFINAENVNAVMAGRCGDVEIGVAVFRDGSQIESSMSPLDLATALNEGIPPDRNYG